MSLPSNLIRALRGKCVHNARNKLNCTTRVNVRAQFLSTKQELKDEKDTHFGFETVKEHEKAEKGYHKKHSPNN